MSKAFKNYRGKRIVTFESDMQIDVDSNNGSKTSIKRDYMQIDIVKNCTKKTYMKKHYMQIDIVKKTVKISNKTDFMQIEEDHQPNIEDIRLIENYLKSYNLNKDIICAYVNDYKYKYSSVLNMGGIYNIHLWGDNMLK